MLRRFVYLDDVSLNQYISALEGGSTTALTKRSLRSPRAEQPELNTGNPPPSEAAENEESHTYTDTPEAQIARLLKAAAADSESLGWIDIEDPEAQFSNVRPGAMVSWSCDLFVPQLVQSLARSGEAVNALAMMQAMMPTAKQLALDTEGLPSTDEMKAMSNFLTNMDAKLLVVGEDEVTDWRVAGQVHDEFLRGDLEGFAHIVGKVSKVIPVGHAKPFMTFPGMNLVPREQRRKMERQAPPEGKEDEYLTGPALMLDILAIYR